MASDAYRKDAHHNDTMHCEKGKNTNHNSTKHALWTDACCLVLQETMAEARATKIKGSPLANLPRLTPELAAEEWDAVVIGSGVGGLTTATQLAVQGQKVLVLERYIIPGGSAGTSYACMYR